MFSRWLSCCIALLLSTQGASQAQIRIGQTAGFSGPVAAGVKETTEGAQMYLDSVNATGGIRGQKIELVSLDDKFEPDVARENATKLIVEQNVLAMFLTRGTPHTEAVLPVLEQYGVALVAPSTGAILLHRPVNRLVFNVRATYQREAEKAITHVATIGVKRVALVHADDSFGRDGLDGANKGLAKAGLQPVLVVKADRSKPDYTTIVPPIISANAQAVLWIGSGTAVADGVKVLRQAGSTALVLTLSNNASNGFIKALGDVASGVVVTQVFPNERSVVHPFVKEALALAKSRGQSAVSPANLEGFAAAKVLVAGLRRAGPKPSRESLIAALEGIRNFNLGGGLEVSYSPLDHTGLDFADLSIIDAEGRFRR